MSRRLVCIIATSSSSVPCCSLEEKEILIVRCHENVLCPGLWRARALGVCLAHQGEGQGSAAAGLPSMWEKLTVFDSSSKFSWLLKVVHRLDAKEHSCSWWLLCCYTADAFTSLGQHHLAPIKGLPHESIPFLVYLCSFGATPAKNFAPKHCKSRESWQGYKRS